MALIRLARMKARARSRRDSRSASGMGWASARRLGRAAMAEGSAGSAAAAVCRVLASAVAAEVVRTKWRRVSIRLLSHGDGVGCSFRVGIHSDRLAALAQAQ